MVASGVPLRRERHQQPETQQDDGEAERAEEAKGTKVAEEAKGAEGAAAERTDGEGWRRPAAAGGWPGECHGAEPVPRQAVTVGGAEAQADLVARLPTTYGAARSEGRTT
jgi:hypothetical protein